MYLPIPLNFDVCKTKHRGNLRSQEAHEKVKKIKISLRDLVLNFISLQGEHGATCEEISKSLERPMHSISGRCSELKIARAVRIDGKRNGGDVLKV